MDTRVKDRCAFAIALLLFGYSSLASAYSVSVNVSGLIGSGLVVQSNRGDDLAILSDGVFTFATALAGGSSYRVSVLTLPSAPAQTCTVAGGAGAIFSDITVAVTCVARYPRFAYVPQWKDDTLSIYSVDAATGQLRFKTYKNIGHYAAAVAITPDNRFAYVANYDSNSISAFRINATTGDLTAAIGSPFAAGLSPTAITADPLGRFLYAVNTAGGTISAYSIHPTSGALAVIAGSPFAAGTQPESITIDPSGKFAYIANTTSNRITAFTIDASTGALGAVAGSPFAAGTNPRRVAIDPSGRFAYAPAFGADKISAFSINRMTGRLTPLGGFPFATGDGPMSIAIDHSGRFAYVANAIDGNVSMYTIDAVTGALSADLGAPVAAGDTPVQTEVDPSGRFVYAVNANDHTVSTYEIRPTGSLRRRPTVVGRKTPREIVITPGSSAVAYAPQFAYVASGYTGPGGNAVYGYTIAPSTGALTAVAGSPFPAGRTMPTIVADGASRFLYAAEFSNQEVWAFGINAVTGSLTAVPGSPFDTLVDRLPYDSAIDPTGRFMYSSLEGSVGGISGNVINSFTGALTYIAGTPFISGTPSYGIAVHPSGRWVFSGASDSIRTFSSSATTGQLTQVSDAVRSGSKTSMAVDFTGQFLFVTEQISADWYLSSYAIDSVSGAVSLAARVSLGAVQFPEVAADPLGKFVFVGYSGASGGVFAFAVSQFSGNLTPVAGSPFAVVTTGHWQPQSISAEPSGKFLYVSAGSWSGCEVVGFSIDPITGVLSAVAGSPLPTGPRCYAMTTTGTIR